MDDVVSFLQTYEHVTNQLACIVRCFLGLDFLKVMYCAGALIGLHLVELYQSLTASAHTIYTNITPAFQQLYQKLIYTDAATRLKIYEPAFKCVSNERFKHSRYDEDICDTIAKIAGSFRPQVIKLLKMSSPSWLLVSKSKRGTYLDLETVRVYKAFSFQHGHTEAREGTNPQPGHRAECRLRELRVPSSLAVHLQRK